MPISQDLQQNIMITIYLLLDAYRILIGSFYVVFVPQLCEDHTCTLEENVTNLSRLNEAALGLNAIFAFITLTGFIVEYKRERWMVKHLEVDPKKADENLVTEITSYPTLEVSLKRKNKMYRNIFYTIAVLGVANIATSGVLVFEYNEGFKTATTFITNTLLILTRVIKSIQIAQVCDKQMKAQSVYLLEPVTFNTIDHDFKKESSDLTPTIPPTATARPNVIEIINQISDSKDIKMIENTV